MSMGTALSMGKLVFRLSLVVFAAIAPAALAQTAPPATAPPAQTQAPTQPPAQQTTVPDQQQAPTAPPAPVNPVDTADDNTGLSPTLILLIILGAIVLLLVIWAFSYGPWRRPGDPGPPPP
ncbi:MAG TPA: hypothetical protein VFA34_15055 [Actinomycetota bacterium]|nr:hypothetical protein [Actinomycetota bacterium]